MYISITELDKMDLSHPKRNCLEKALKKIIGDDGNTTEEMRSYYKQVGISEEDIKEEIEESGIRFKHPIELRAGDEMSKIHDLILEVGHRSFIKKIPELKKFWQNELRGLEF